MLTTKQEIQNTILHCDPLVGETACQIRAIHLLHLYNQVQKDLTLTPVELEYINYCELLTKSKEDRFGEFNMIDSGTINTSKVTHLYKSQELTSKVIALKQSKIAAMGVEFMQSIAPVSFFQDHLDKYLENEFLYKSSSKKHLSVIPCFISTQLMLLHLMNTNSLLIINLKRILVHDYTHKDLVWRSSYLLSLSR